MISDRNYFRKRWRNGGPSQAAGGIGVVFTLIIANLLVFVIQGMLPTADLAMTSRGVANLELWRLVTYMFLHGDFWHFLFNMWGLYLFGTLVAPRVGSNNFLAIYFISGVMGALLWFAFNMGSPIPMIGSSGGVLGVVLAAAMFYPDTPIMLLFPPIPMRLRTLAIVFICVDIFQQVSGSPTGIAHMAHLGGTLGAYLYLKIFYPRDIWDPLGFIFGGRRSPGKPVGFSASAARDSGWRMGGSGASPGGGAAEGRVSQREVDAILDKISARGINSLSEDELGTLRRAREEMKGAGR